MKKRKEGKSRALCGSQGSVGSLRFPEFIFIPVVTSAGHSPSVFYWRSPFRSWNINVVGSPPPHPKPKNKENLVRRAGMELSPSFLEGRSFKGLYGTYSQFKVRKLVPQTVLQRPRGAGLGSSSELKVNSFQHLPRCQREAPLVSWGMSGCRQFWVVPPCPSYSSSAQPHCLSLTCASREGLGDSSVLKLVTD